MMKINIALLLVLFLVTSIALASQPANIANDFDSTDYDDERSGLILLIDAATGCHYLRSGSLVPRVDSNGRHICGGSTMELQLKHVAKEKSKQRIHDKRTLEILEMEKRSRD